MRYGIGIDLGTTHTALSFTDLQARGENTQLFSIRQYSDPQTSVERSLLPSFLWFPREGEEREAFPPLFSEKAPTRALVIGEYAQRAAFAQGGRVVQSAKSWLAQRTVDPEAPVLPWGSEEIEPEHKLSALEASQRLLQHLVQAWDARMLEPLAGQRVVITVPASFDETAQELTLEAARRAGIPKAVLLEEPQAAFYAWLQKLGGGGERRERLFEVFPALREREVHLLVCDVGGGTTDFSLFRIEPLAEGQRIPRIHRTAVSDHVLLGGDNLDLKLASLAEAEFDRTGQRLDSAARFSLLSAARTAKEALLGDLSGPDEVSFAVAGRSSNLFAAARSVQLSREVLRRELIDGFFPRVARDAEVQSARSGLRQLGLQYAEDPAVTRHLAAFLRERPAIDAVLFNGGTLIPQVLQDRLLENLTDWQGQRPLVLPGADFTTAVAQGAAFFSGLERESTARIRAGYPRAVFVELDTKQRLRAKPLLCVLPRGAEPGSVHRIAGDSLGLQLRVGTPVQFQLFTDRSASELDSGKVIEADSPTLHRLAPMQTSLASDHASTLAVDLEARVSETGLLELHCVHRGDARESSRWKLRFNLRRAEDTSGEGEESAVQDPRLTQAIQKLQSAYAKKMQSESATSPKALRRELERLFDGEIHTWEVAHLRPLADTLLTGSRGRSPEHERVWYQLIGFFMRPGCGAALDPWRMDRLWPVFEHGVVHPAAPGNLAQWWLLWRRVSGGLDAARQQRVLNTALPQLKKKSLATPEIILTAGAMERADWVSRSALADLLLKWIENENQPVMGQSLWALARLASRLPLHAGLEAVAPKDFVQRWLARVLEAALDPTTPNYALFLSQAARCTGEPAIDLSPEWREAAAERLRETPGSRLVDSVLTPSIADGRSQAEVFGEELPPGLRLLVAPPISPTLL